MKKEYILLSIVTVVLGTYLYFQDSDYTQYSLPKLGAVKDTEISKIEIIKKDTKLVLNKEKQNWTIGEEKYPADTAKVNDVLNAIKELKLTALISESENYPRYNLDTENKIEVTAYNKEKILRRFDVGKAAPSYKHTYIKLDGNKKVYQVAKNLNSTLNISFDRVVEKTVMQLKPEEATTFSVTDSGDKFEFAKKMEETKVKPFNDDKKKEDNGEKPIDSEVKWFSSNGDKKDSSAINDFLKKFSNIDCDSYAKGMKKEALKDLVFAVTIKTDEEYSLFAFKSNEKDKFICTSSKTSFPFYLSSSKISGFKDAFKKI